MKLIILIKLIVMSSLVELTLCKSPLHPGSQNQLYNRGQGESPWNQQQRPKSPSSLQQSSNTPSNARTRYPLKPRMPLPLTRRESPTTNTPKVVHPQKTLKDRMAISSNERRTIQVRKSFLVSEPTPPPVPASKPGSSQFASQNPLHPHSSPDVFSISVSTSYGATPSGQAASKGQQRQVKRAVQAQAASQYIKRRESNTQEFESSQGAPSFRNNQKMETTPTTWSKANESLLCKHAQKNAYTSFRRGGRGREGRGRRFNGGRPGGPALRRRYRRKRRDVSEDGGQRSTHSSSPPLPSPSSRNQSELYNSEKSDDDDYSETETEDLSNDPGPPYSQPDPARLSAYLASISPHFPQESLSLYAIDTWDSESYAEEEVRGDGEFNRRSDGEFFGGGGIQEANGKRRLFDLLDKLKGDELIIPAHGTYLKYQYEYPPPKGPGYTIPKPKYQYYPPGYVGTVGFPRYKPSSPKSPQIIYAPSPVKSIAKLKIPMPQAPPKTFKEKKLATLALLKTLLKPPSMFDDMDIFPKGKSPYEVKGEKYEFPTTHTVNLGEGWSQPYVSAADYTPAVHRPPYYQGPMEGPYGSQGAKPYSNNYYNSGGKKVKSKPKKNRYPPATTTTEEPYAYSEDDDDDDESLDYDDDEEEYMTQEEMFPPKRQNKKRNNNNYKGLKPLKIGEDEEGRGESSEDKDKDKDIKMSSGARTGRKAKFSKSRGGSRKKNIDPDDSDDVTKDSDDLEPLVIRIPKSVRLRKGQRIFLPYSFVLETK